MKKYSILALTLVLTAVLFTGCGCRNTKPMETIAPTTMPTTQATTEPTHATTMPTETHSTIPAESNETNATNETIDHGNGPLEEGSAATENTTGENRARNHVPNGR